MAAAMRVAEEEVQAEKEEEMHKHRSRTQVIRRRSGDLGSVSSMEEEHDASLPSHSASVAETPIPMMLEEQESAVSSPGIAQHGIIPTETRAAMLFPTPWRANKEKATNQSSLLPPTTPHAADVQTQPSSGDMLLAESSLYTWQTQVFSESLTSAPPTSMPGQRQAVQPLVPRLPPGKHTPAYKWYHPSEQTPDKVTALLATGNARLTIKDHEGKAGSQDSLSVSSVAETMAPVNKSVGLLPPPALTIQSSVVLRSKMSVVIGACPMLCVSFLAYDVFGL